MDRSMKFFGYIIICEDKDKNLFYLRENFLKGEYFLKISLYKAIYINKKIHKIKKEELKKHVIFCEEELKLKIKIILPIFISDEKPFMGKIEVKK